MMKSSTIQISSFLPKAFLDKASFFNGENQMDIFAHWKKVKEDKAHFPVGPGNQQRVP